MADRIQQPKGKLKMIVTIEGVTRPSDREDKTNFTFIVPLALNKHQGQ
jgi:hypothetical protein